MSQPNGTTHKMVNGNTVHSQTLSHIISYPLVSDTMNIYQNHPLGASTINLFNNIYSSFAEPVLPYFRGPYSLIAPYVQKADQLGNSTLNTVDDKIPAVKQTDMEDLKAHAFSIAHLPIKVAFGGRDYVFNTFNDEYRKTGGAGLAKTAKAFVSTELRITADAIHMVADMLGPRVQRMANEADHLAKGAGQLAKDADLKAGQLARGADQKAGQMLQNGKKWAERDSGDLKKVADRTAQDMQNAFFDAKNNVNQTTQQAKRTAQDKKDELTKH